MTEPRLARWVHRRLLRLYPAQFRQDYEREVVSVLRRQLERQPGAVWTWLFFLDVCVSTVWYAPGVHRHMLSSALSYASRVFRCSLGFTAVFFSSLCVV